MLKFKYKETDKMSEISTVAVEREIAACLMAEGLDTNCSDEEKLCHMWNIYCKTQTSLQTSLRSVEELRVQQAEEMKEFENYVEHVRSLSNEREALTIEFANENDNLKAENEQLRQELEMYRSDEARDMLLQQGLDDIATATTSEQIAYLLVERARLLDELDNEDQRTLGSTAEGSPTVEQLQKTLKQERREFDNELSHQREALKQAAEQQGASHEEEVGTLLAEIERLQEVISAARIKIETLQRDSVQTQHLVGDSIPDDAQAAIEELKADNTTLAENYGTVMLELQTAQASLAAERTAHDQDLERHRQDRGMFDQQLHVLEANNQKLTLERKSQDLKLDYMERQVEDLREQEKNLSARLRAGEKQMEKEIGANYREEIERLKEEICQKGHDLELTSATLQQEKDHSSELETKYRQTETELAEQKEGRLSTEQQQAHKIATLETQVSSLQQDLEQKVSQVAAGKDLAAMLKQAESELRDARFDALTAQQDKEAAESQVQHLSLQSNALRSRVEEEQENVKNLMSENSQLKSEKSQMHADKMQLQSQNSHLEAENSRLQAEKSQIYEEKLQMQSGNSNVEVEKSQLLSERAHLQSERTQLLEEKSLLLSQKSHAESDVVRLEADNSTLQTEVNRLQTESASNNTKSIKLQTENSQLQADNDQLQTTLSEKDCHLSRLEKQLKKEQEFTDASLKEKDGQTDVRVAQLENQLDELRSENSRLTERLNGRQGEVDRLMEQLTSNKSGQQGALSLLQQELSDVRSSHQREYQTVSSHSEEVSTENRKLRERLIEKDQELSTLNTQVTRGQHSEESLQRRLEAAEKMRSEVQSHNTELQQQAEEAWTKLKDLVEKVSTLELNNEQLQAELDRKTGASKSSELMLTQKVLERESQVKLAETRVHSTEQQLYAIQSDLESATQRLGSAEGEAREAASLRQQLDTARNEITTLRNQLQDEKLNRSKLSSGSEELVSQMSLLKQREGDLQRRNNELQRTLLDVEGKLDQMHNTRSITNMTNTSGVCRDKLLSQVASLQSEVERLQQESTAQAERYDSQWHRYADRKQRTKTKLQKARDLLNAERGRLRGEVEKLQEQLVLERSSAVREQEWRDNLERSHHKLLVDKRDLLTQMAEVEEQVRDMTRKLSVLSVRTKFLEEENSTLQQRVDSLVRQKHSLDRIVKEYQFERHKESGIETQSSDDLTADTTVNYKEVSLPAPNLSSLLITSPR